MMNLTSPRAALSALLGLAIVATTLPAQTTPADSTTGRRRIQPFPALGSAPETGLQFGLTVLSVFEPPAQRHARPASVVATALRSTKGQTRLSVEGEHWSANNDRRLQGLLAWQKFPLPYYGVGTSSPERAKELYTPTGVEATGTVQQRIRGAWYALATARFITQDITPDSATGALALDSRIVGRTGGRVSELGVGLLRDSRDYVFNPTRGTLAQVTYAVSASATGSEFAYERLRLDARKYTTLGGSHVLALHAQLIGTTGAPPFDQLALIGGGDIMRGYTRGRYRNAWLTAAQMEYRSPIRRRLGAVAFMGVGTVASNASGLVDYMDAIFLPTIGVGARIQIDARQRTAVRVDYGRGRDDANGLYIGFNQAF